MTVWDREMVSQIERNASTATTFAALCVNYEMDAWVRGSLMPGQAQNVTVPYSELAMHSGIAGWQIIRVAVSRNGRCGMILATDGQSVRMCDGLLDEVLAPEYQRDIFRIQH